MASAMTTQAGKYLVEAVAISDDEEEEEEEQQQQQQFQDDPQHTEESQNAQRLEPEPVAPNFTELMKLPKKRKTTAQRKGKVLLRLKAAHINVTVSLCEGEKILTLRPDAADETNTGTYNRHVYCTCV